MSVLDCYTRPTRERMKSRARLIDDPRTGQFHGNVAVRRHTEHVVLIRTTPTENAADRKDFHYHNAPFFWALIDGDATELLESGEERCYRPLVPVYTSAGVLHAHCRGKSAPTGLGLILQPSCLELVHQLSKVEPSEILDPAASHTISRLNSEASREDSASDLAIEGLTYELLANAIRYSTGARDRSVPKWLLKARDLLHDRQQERIRISEIACEVGIHPVHLSAEFRRFFGATPGHYLRQIRLTSAAGILSRSREPVGSIAAEFGFYDEAHFARSFKAAFGVTPTEYRREKNASTGRSP